MLVVTMLTSRRSFIAITLLAVASASSAKVCTTENCQRAANMYREGMNLKINPCQNFYQYACGAWPASNPIPYWSNGWNRQLALQQHISLILKGTLERPVEQSDPPSLQDAKKLYQSCMATDIRNARGIGTIASILENNGGWPMAMSAGKWSENASSWQNIDAQYSHLTGDYTFYHIQAALIISGGSAGKHLVLSEPSNDDWFNAGVTYTEYRSIVEPVVELFIRHNKTEVSADQLENDIHAMYALERDLFAARGTNIRNYLMTLNSLLAQWNHKVQSLSDPNTMVNWKEVILRLIADAPIELINEGIIPIDKDYYFQLPRIWASTSKRTIVNYIHWKFVRNLLRFTTEELERTFSESASSNHPRWMQCLKETEMEPGRAAWFLENYFGEAEQRTVQMMVKNLKATSKQQIDQSNWLLRDSQMALKAKIDQMHVYAGFLGWNNNQTLGYPYDKLNINDDYVQNTLSYQKYVKIAQLRFVTSSSIPADVIYSPLELQARYVAVNTVVMPAAFFQLPFYASEIPEYLKYGAMATLIGTEMNRAFDNERINVGPVGVTEPLNIFMKYNYLKQAYGIWSQTKNNFRNDTIASKTLRDNIADILGLQTAIKAYLRLMEGRSSKAELKLPHFETFTDEQMFFIAFGGRFCEAAAPPPTDPNDAPHIPPEWRVNLAVSNTLEFAKAFNCPLGGAMNPVQKSTVWTRSHADRPADLSTPQQLEAWFAALRNM